jgi:hypothetical protein
MDTIAQDIITPAPGTLLYADDIVLSDTNRMSLEKRVQDWSDRLARYGLQLNLDKTEYLESGNQTEGTITISGRELNKTTRFIYLGSCISADGSSSYDVIYRTKATWAKWREMSPVLCDKHIPSPLKAKIYKTVIRPTAIYGSECRPSTRKDEHLLHCAEMRMLRWSLGLTLKDRIRNQVVHSKLAVRPIEDKIREARLRW